MVYLPKHASIEQACRWLHEKTGEEWVLARLLECHLTPHFWLDFMPEYPTLYGGRVEGYLTRMMFHGDVCRLEADGTDALVNMVASHDGQVVKIEPAMRVPLAELRFLRSSLERVAAIVIKESESLNPHHPSELKPAKSEEDEVKEMENSFPVWVEIRAQKKYRAEVEADPVNSFDERERRRVRLTEIDGEIARLTSLVARGPNDAEPAIRSATPEGVASDADCLKAVAASVEKAGIAASDWKLRIQCEATARWKTLRKAGASPTIRSICDLMVPWCRKENVRTDSGINPSHGYLRTHVLGGKHWKPPRT